MKDDLTNKFKTLDAEFSKHQGMITHACNIAGVSRRSYYNCIEGKASIRTYQKLIMAMRLIIKQYKQV